MDYSIEVEKRTGKDADDVRQKGYIPGVVYGPERESTSISVSYNEFEKLNNEVGGSNLINLTIKGEKEPIIVLIQEVQYDPVKDKIIHMDFRQIKMGEEMQTSISLNIIGESTAVKELGGTLMKNIDMVNIKCLPRDLVGSVDVDISELKTFDDAIYISNLKLPKGIETTDNPDTLIAKVAAPLTEEQLKALEEEEAPSVEEVEVEEKGKKDEEGEEDKDEKAEAKDDDKDKDKEKKEEDKK